MRRVYAMLLRWYPYDYRSRFGAEMLATMNKAKPVKELGGLLTGAVREWIAKWTTPDWIRGRHLPDDRMMRPAGVSKQVWFG
jgi:hypothetical protein